VCIARERSESECSINERDPQASGEMCCACVSSSFRPSSRIFLDFTSFEENISIFTENSLKYPKAISDFTFFLPGTAEGIIYTHVYTRVYTHACTHTHVCVRPITHTHTPRRCSGWARTPTWSACGRPAA